jgi:[ribosomal protein S18]-alanine N-acetyltransferase
MTTKQAAALYVRWMIRRDLEEALAIEAASHVNGWSEEDFLRVLRQRNVIGMVCELRDNPDHLLGFMVYALEKRSIDILDFAVAPDYRRGGVGGAMAAKLKSKTTGNERRRPLIRLECRETNLGGLLFWKAMGFIATDVLRGTFEDTGEDGIRMKWRQEAGDP